MDVWQYIKSEEIELPSLYFSHQREVVERNGTLLALTDFISVQDGGDGRDAHRAVPHRRRCDLHRCGRI